MKEKNNTELLVEEVNVYADIDYNCGKIQYKCVTDCIFSLPLLSTED